MVGLQAQLARDLLRDVHAHAQLLVLAVQLIAPILRVQKGFLQNGFAPLHHERLAILALFGQENGKGKVQVRMGQLVHLHTGTTRATRIGNTGRLTKQVAGIGQRQRQVSTTARTEVQLGVGHAPFAHVADQLRLQFAVPGDARKKHVAKVTVDRLQPEPI